ncbi:hypothetical protein J7E70_13090 [Variovorax paradoxus]|nr:hypothetical protein [Variovorax paradoxus]
MPVLGVCLGHQAMAHACGATVDLAVRPMHGRLPDSINYIAIQRSSATSNRSTESQN